MKDRYPEPQVELFIDHDPLHPHPEEPTPLDMVLALTRPQREKRVERLIELAWMRYEQAIQHFITDRGKTLHSTCILFSGGKDSSTIATLFRPVATHLLHANTRTGIEATRDFVRDTAAAWNMPLIMESSQDDYFDMVLGRLCDKKGHPIWAGGFPGPGAHGITYQRLKERAFDRIRHTLGIANSRSERSLWFTGRRRPESQARNDIPHSEGDGSVVWLAALAVWHKADLLTLRLMHGSDSDTPVPDNPVARILGMSAECGCLANAHPGERETWFKHFPNEPFLLRVLEVEAELRKPQYSHIPDHMKTWGWGADHEDVRDPNPGRLCGRDCGPDPLLDLMDPLFSVAS